MANITKLDIHELFVFQGETTRSGGGTLKKKYMYSRPSDETQKNMYEKIKHDSLLEKYFKKLQLRDRKLAPPPKPKKLK